MNQTKLVCGSDVVPARIESGSPVGYRLARKPDGDIVLQGAFQWSQGCDGGIEWREIPTHVIEQVNA